MYHAHIETSREAKAQHDAALRENAASRLAANADKRKRQKQAAQRSESASA